MYSNEVYDIIIIGMIVIILWLWNMKWWVSELKWGPDPLDPPGSTPGQTYKHSYIHTYMHIHIHANINTHIHT